ncbi:MAG: hypothetical protein CK534_00320 [Nitrospirae bacterium]|nr:MAG: hypothetical protein CK534_00320 [Nitrospirota bacterium]
MAPLLKKEDGSIDWTLPAVTLANRIRGLAPWPGAYTAAPGSDRWTIWRAHALPGPATKTPGTVVAVTNEAIHVATGEGVLALLELQPANSRRMGVAQYVAGHPIAVGLQLGRPIPS